jgi:hypothetical protein
VLVRAEMQESNCWFSCGCVVVVYDVYWVMCTASFKVVVDD